MSLLYIVHSSDSMKCMSLKRACLKMSVSFCRIVYCLSDSVGMAVKKKVCRCREVYVYVRRKNWKKCIQILDLFHFFDDQKSMHLQPLVTKKFQLICWPNILKFETPNYWKYTFLFCQ
jgi:hypothetical protein